MTSGSSVYRKARLLREFDRTLERVRPLFADRFGDEPVRVMFEEARKEYEVLIPQLPDIGGGQPHTQFLIATAWFLAMYRVLKRRGVGVEEIGLLSFQASEAYLRAYPGFLRRAVGLVTFSRSYVRKVRQHAAESREKRYPDGYVYDFVEGDGTAFDFGVDYVECAGLKLLQAQGAPDLAPYLCAGDVLYSDALGWGLVRTTTLAEGMERCDFRFKQGRKTQVAVVPALQEYLAGRSG